ncbi:hypothetical protein B0H14DRAFT_3431685 [Mycena olivaceomarginata]|nr:hypothetical protein B0H14DRAFT_3431685 [Mycena olivaceomarginata]
MCRSPPQSTDEFYGFNYNAKNYISPGAIDYPYYVRKHNPLHVSLRLQFQLPK